MAIIRRQFLVLQLVVRLMNIQQQRARAALVLTSVPLFPAQTNLQPILFKCNEPTI
jgi:hypothetical protein